MKVYENFQTEFETNISYLRVYSSFLGGCLGVRINEENARFGLLAVCLILYMIFGAIVFHFLERDNEEKEKNNYYRE